MIELMYVNSNPAYVTSSDTLTSSARGNTSLESAVSLTKSLRWEIQTLGQRLATAAHAEEMMRRGASKAQNKAQNALELGRIIQAIRKLLNRIEDAVPLINLAITASGASLTSSLPSSVSPSRLLQASTFLTAGDTQYSISSSTSVQIGPTFILSMYMLFLGHLRPQNEEDVRESTWKEVIHKAVVKLVRVSIQNIYSLPGTEQQTKPQTVNNDDHNETDEAHGYFPPHVEADGKADEYAYQLVIVEDLEDGRLHTLEENEEQPSSYDDIAVAGIREAIPIHEISKIFYADTGKILNIGNEGETNSPVLLLKRDVNAIEPRRMMDRHGEDSAQDYNIKSTNWRHRSTGTNGHYDSESQTDQSGQQGNSSLVSSQTLSHMSLPSSDPRRLPLDLDPEWIAFEVYTESADSDAESEAESSSTKPARSSRSPSLDSRMTSALSRLKVQSPITTPTSASPLHPPNQPLRPSLLPIRTSLSLLETLLRLLSLQQFQQTPHLSIPDELLTFFLSESASTGTATSDSQERKRLRTEARRRVGFDPYDESPVKQRGEEYQYRASEETSWDNGRRPAYEDYEGFSPIDERYGTPIRYSSPRYHDEGYGTHNWTPSRGSQPLSSERGTPPQTPPLLLQPNSNSPRSDVPVQWRGGRRNLGGSEGETRKGSPLARPGTGITDEGLGTSPASEAALAIKENK